MTSLLFAIIVLICLIVIEPFLVPLHLLGPFQMPAWVSVTAALFLLAWLIKD